MKITKRNNPSGGADTFCAAISISYPSLPFSSLHETVGADGQGRFRVVYPPDAGAKNALSAARRKAAPPRGLNGSTVFPRLVVAIVTAILIIGGASALSAIRKKKKAE